MVKVKKEGVLLSTTDFEFENEGVLNPAVVREGDTLHLLYRAVRKGNFSSIGYAKLEGPLKVVDRMISPLLAPDNDYEKHGMEDPRLVKIDDTYYLSYIAFDGKDALGALATSKDLVHFEKKGIIVPQLKCGEFDDLAKQNNNDIISRYRQDYSSPDTIIMDKDVVFFPRRINGKLTFMHRIKPDIQLVSVDSLDELTEEFWDDYVTNLGENVMLTPKNLHELSYVGAGCPPVETEHGWLVIYHGVQHFDTGYQYNACAALFDLDDPRKEIARLPYALFQPDQPFELAGDVDNVCFPTGTAVFDDTLYIYYGAGDDVIATASVSLKELADELLTFKPTQTIA
ncbi:hypothetical protein [Mucilaginibacter sp. dw_454]|uniref:glycoside hydrolase family 130 protein n=1 Tax=Mucilaginibacter sp. dw_454 TaxID=2720079 RepID=UPI001BD2DB4D|nr:hypothetical protein [Mucilaginibacter sp. dw_454]